MYFSAKTPPNCQSFQLMRDFLYFSEVLWDFMGFSAFCGIFCILIAKVFTCWGIFDISKGFVCISVLKHLLIARVYNLCGMFCFCRCPCHHQLLILSLCHLVIIILSTCNHHLAPLVIIISSSCHLLILSSFHLLSCHHVILTVLFTQVYLPFTFAILFPPRKASGATWEP